MRTNDRPQPSVEPADDPALRRRSRDFAEAARQWAQQRGVEVPRRGRVPPGVLAAYRRSDCRLLKRGV